MGPAIEHWRRSVETHHAQSARIQADSMWQCGDFWQPLASIFRADPHRTDDQVLNRLAREVGPGQDGPGRRRWRREVRSSPRAALPPRDRRRALGKHGA